MVREKMVDYPPGSGQPKSNREGEFKRLFTQRRAEGCGWAALDSAFSATWPSTL